MRESIFDVWAPPAARWTAWVKPILFACMSDAPEAAAESVPPLPAWVPPPETTALVLDLPGADSIWLGIAAAQHGYQPVPIFNAVPGQGDTGTQVDVMGLVHALKQATPLLSAAPSPATAPPAFLLHAERRTATLPLLPGSYDNRSVVLTTDFPSAVTLYGHGIRSVLLVQTGRQEVESDLAHVLRHWQDAGLAVSMARLDSGLPPVAIAVSKPSTFGLIWYKILETLGFHRHILGGFGGLIPDLSAGG